MIVFEDRLAEIVNQLPSLTVNGTTLTNKFNWGTESVLAEYLTLQGIGSFPLIWLVEGQDTNDLREPTVKRNARIVILYQSEQPTQFNPYQHEFDYKLILQPILDNLLTALTQSNISRYDNKTFKTQRVKNYSMKEVDKSLVYVCNAIVLDAEITLTSGCINTQINF